jgi:1-acyl-sn-glycerol-3-phosphate acyltransferase
VAWLARGESHVSEQSPTELKARRRQADRKISVVAAIMRPPLMAITKRDWQGQHHIPATGGAIVVANHTSVIDPPLMAHYVWDAKRSPRFLAKASLFTVPIAGWALSSAAQIPVYRQSRDASKAYEAAVEAVRRGECVVIYPEGTTTKDPDGWPMLGKTGAARIALATGAPVIPVAQWGTQQALPAGAKLPRVRGRIPFIAHAGPPIDLSDLQGQPLTATVLREATARFMLTLAQMVGQIRGVQPPEGLYDPATGQRVGGAA